ncbi:hypothetical protein [Ornithinimicrobium kibberense]|uniref:hypothetical protein n=1 Tax=Ornithinimicrobium kibberense TaxID=282060 RepID=UPI003612A8CB
MTPARATRGRRVLSRLLKSVPSPHGPELAVLYGRDGILCPEAAGKGYSVSQPKGAARRSRLADPRGRTGGRV